MRDSDSAEGIRGDFGGMLFLQEDLDIKEEVNRILGDHDAGGEGSEFESFVVGTEGEVLR